MQDNLMTLKTAIAAFCTAWGAFLGWQGIMALVWVAVMALDHSPARQAAMVVVAAVADGAMAVLCDNLPLEMAWPGVVLPLVLAWYILTELGSILENAVKMGAAVPPWLVKLLKAGLDAVDSKVEPEEVM